MYWIAFSHPSDTKWWTTLTTIIKTLQSDVHQLIELFSVHINVHRIELQMVSRVEWLRRLIPWYCPTWYCSCTMWYCSYATCYCSCTTRCHENHVFNYYMQLYTDLSQYNEPVIVLHRSQCADQSQFVRDILQRAWSVTVLHRCLAMHWISHNLMQINRNDLGPLQSGPLDTNYFGIIT